jgi:hypothetical protein
MLRADLAGSSRFEQRVSMLQFRSRPAFGSTPVQLSNMLQKKALALPMRTSPKA